MPQRMYAAIFPNGNPTEGDIAEPLYRNKAWRSAKTNTAYYTGDLLMCKVGHDIFPVAFCRATSLSIWIVDFQASRRLRRVK
uniref:WGS project CBMI000000000 data, contig CS3069_c002633 n=1 Tax=Fusarium clavum TaxID=2594811 RepID=A0A090MCW6_9HYPO|nr:unnamed protein product [Fusarium clavum]